jgi:hypothetical protein
VRLGIIGSLRLVEKVHGVIKCSFSQIEPVDLAYRNYKEAPAIAQYHQQLLDAILFTGTTPYMLARDFIKPSVICDYLPRSGSSLLRALLEAVLIKNYDVCNVSFDTYDEKSIYKAYAEIGINSDKLKLYSVERPPYGANMESLIAAHERNYYKKGVSFCLTPLSSVYEQLQAKNIPCIRIDPTTSIIEQTLQKLQLSHLAYRNQESQIVALSVQIDPHGEYFFFNDNEYQYVIEKTKVTNQIYLFAQRIQAAIIETGLRDYLLFSTRFILENVTDNLQNIDLLNSIQQNTSSTVSLGIGYGKTAREAKQAAGIAMSRANRMGGNMAFVLFNGKDYIGPIKNSENKNDAGEKFDSKFHVISEKTGLSINTIFRLFSICQLHTKNSFTPKELAGFFGVTQRTMNRLIAKLEKNGFCEVIGNKIMSNTGRPSRIIQLNLNV